MFGLARMAGTLPSNHTREWMAGGGMETATTIRRMRDLVTQGKRDFRVRTFIGRNIINNCPAKDYYCYAEAAHNFCTTQIKYAFDPNGVELIESPWKVIESGIADCDSIVILFATIVESLGMPARFVTIKADKSRPNDFSHVFAEVKIPRKGWVAADCTMADKPFGWTPPDFHARKNWPASNDSPESHDDDAMAGVAMSGLGNLGKENIPGVEASRGLITGQPFEFRVEPTSLVLGSPEEVELDPLQTGTPRMIGEPEPNYFMADEAPLMFPDAALDQKVAMREASKEEVNKVVAAEESKKNNMIFWGAIALVGFIGLASKR